MKEITDSMFSWRRVLMFGHYYSPTVTKQLIIYAAFSLMCSILVFIVPLEAQSAITSACNMALSFMVYLAPLILARRGYDRIYERLIPATALEKLTFYLLYFLVVVPLATYLFPITADLILYRNPDLLSETMQKMEELRFDYTSITPYSSMLQTALLVLVCLWTVVATRTSRMLKGILAVIGSMFGFGIYGGILGIATAIHKIDAGVSLNNPDALANAIIEEVANFNAANIIWLIILVGVCGIAVWQIYATLRRKNL